MITVENCLPLLLGWVCYTLITVFLEGLCSCYFPFLLSARFYYTIKSPTLRSILISPQRTRDKGSKTAPKDRNKLPLLGCIYCVVTFLWLFCEIIVILLVFVLAVLKSDFLYSQIMSSLISILEFLFVNKFFLIFIAGMPVLYMVDYSLGLRRWQKRQSR